MSSNYLISLSDHMSGPKSRVALLRVNCKHMADTLRSKRIDSEKDIAPSQDHMGISINEGSPKWLVYNGRSQSKMDDLVVVEFYWICLWAIAIVIIVYVLLLLLNKPKFPHQAWFLVRILLKTHWRCPYLHKTLTCVPGSPASLDANSSTWQCRVFYRWG